MRRQLRDNESHVSFFQKESPKVRIGGGNEQLKQRSLSSECIVMESIKDYPLWGSCRLTLVILGFFGAMLISILRFNFSMAIVCMTDDKTEGDDNDEAEFNWNKSTIGYLLSAFFYGEKASLKNSHFSMLFAV